MEIKEQILHLLLQKGFNFRFYESQNLFFYTKEITEPVLVKWFAEENCNLHDYDFTNVSITIEIMSNFESAQYVFLNGIEEHHLFEDLEKFKGLLERLPNQIEIR